MLLEPGGGDAIVIGPARMLVKTPADTDGVFVAEHEFPPGFVGPGLHQHPAMAHAFYVLEGRVDFHLDGMDTTNDAGTFVYVPPSLTHSFGNSSASSARVLEINVPGGFDRYYAELARVFAPGVAIDPEVLRELQRRNGIVPV